MSKVDPTTKAKTDTVVGGMLTRKSGEFSLENLPVMGQFTLSVTAIGYELFEIPLVFDRKSGADQDLGNLRLELAAELLEAVTISGEKPLMQMGIDRKIFNVDKNINSAGGTAVDVMRNIPALNVDIDGNVTLRNSAPQIFVDGRPSTLTLEQIPSDAIESVEMITNPSAKFDASTGQAGILNIVLKKNRKIGYNGGVRAGVDSRGRLNAGGDINVRQGKVNVFASAFLNQRKSKSWGETDRVNLADDPHTSTFQRNDGISSGSFGFTRFGLDFFANNRNTFSITQSIMGGNFKSDNLNNLIYRTAGAPDLESQYRNTLGDRNFRNYTTTLGYKHVFPQTGRELTADVNYSHSPNSGFSDIYIRSFSDLEQQDPKFPEQLQQITNGGSNEYIVVQADYVHPLNEKMKWEAGLRSQTRTSSSNQRNYLNGISRPSLDNDFQYTDNVYAAYGIFSQKINDGLSYQVGLRAESSNYTGEQVGKAAYQNDFPLSLFPSVFFTKNIGENQDLQLNYSRKINRPNFFQLMPNTDFSDTLNLQTGNPGLRPEFTHSLELSYQKIYGERNNTFLVNLFGKATTDLIARYQSLEPIGDTSAFVSTWINANTAYAAGVELIFNNKLTDWWELNFNTNIYYSKINGSNVVPDLENERISSFSKINNTFKINKTWSVQLSGNYQSRSALPVSTSNSGGGGGRGGGYMGGPPSSTQGYIEANYSIDLGVRKDFKIRKNQASLSLNVSDLLRSRIYSVHSASSIFLQDEWRRRDAQMVRLNFSYRFGKFDASLFKRRNTRSEGGNMQGMDGM